MINPNNLSGLPALSMLFGTSSDGKPIGVEIRIRFVFDPWRSAILLIAGDKSGQWSRWYREAIPEAEQFYAT
jgi:hypothetical protein